MGLSFYSFEKSVFFRWCVLVRITGSYREWLNKKQRFRDTLLKNTISSKICLVHQGAYRLMKLQILTDDFASRTLKNAESLKHCSQMRLCWKLVWCVSVHYTPRNTRLRKTRLVRFCALHTIKQQVFITFSKKYTTGDNGPSQEREGGGQATGQFGTETMP